MVYIPTEVVDAVTASTTRVTASVEFYEQDGVTRWELDDGQRLVEGTVTVDYSRDERRALDLTISNHDHAFLTAPDYLFYDKVIKVFRGVRLNQKDRPPRVIIIGSNNSTLTANFRAALAEKGFDDVRIDTTAASLTDLEGYEVVVSLGGPSSPPNIALVQSAYDAGYAVFTEGDDTSGTNVPFITAYNGSTSRTSWPITPNASLSHALAAGWASESYGTATGTLPTTIASYAISVSPVTISGTPGYTIVAAENPNSVGGKWVHFHPNITFTDNFKNFLDTAFSWLNPYVPMDEWNYQLGEFLIDKISEDNFPFHIKITARDYTKRCLGSKFTRTTEFSNGQALETVLTALAANAGVTKIALPITGVTIARKFSYEKGTPRWKVMKEMANAYNYDIYFDNQGYLRISTFVDPVNTPSVVTLKTGSGSNMGSYNKSTEDSRLYNHVIVTGNSPNKTTLPPFGEAKNENPASPVCIAEIGDRLYQFDSQFITTDAQAQATADNFLKIRALEQYNLSFSSLAFFWLDVGSIIEWIDPRPAPDDPTMFLLQTLSIPVGKGLMSGTAGRVVKVV